MDFETIKWVGGGGAAIALFGKFIVPLLKRVFSNAIDNAAAAGNILANVQTERDQWKTRAEAADASLQSFLKEWVEMKSKFDLVQYQLTQAMADRDQWRARAEKLEVTVQSLQKEWADMEQQLKQTLAKLRAQQGGENG